MLQPTLQVLVWVTDCPTQIALGSTAGVHGSLPHTTGQAWVLQAWLCVSTADPGHAPPHASGLLLLLVLLLLCVPPLQVALQAPQALHCDQDPHSQSLAGFVPSTLRRSAQSLVLQPMLQALVWMTDCPGQAVEVAGVHGSSPHSITQGCMLQAWLCVSTADPGHAPPHASGVVLALNLLLSCEPPPQDTLQSSQALHCDQDPHSQLLGCFVPDVLRLVAQSPSLQPGSQVLVWRRNWLVQIAAALGDQGAPQETVGFAREQVPEFEPSCSPSQRHW